MFIKIILACCLLVQPTVFHYIGNIDECTASKVCNHTWTSVCGQILGDASTFRLFLDDCDLHEFNCDNNVAYVEVENEVCSQKCTQQDHAETSSEATAITTPPQVRNTEAVTETTKYKTDTSIELVAQTTIETTGETENTTVTEITTKTITTTNEATDTTTVNTSALTEVTTVKPDCNTTIANTEPLIKTIENNTNDVEEPIVEVTTQTVSDSTTIKLKPNCYDEHCSLPSTWETTSEGETRDFVQILRERYGANGFKLLRGSTHFPKKPVYYRKSDKFIAEHHVE